MATYVISYDLHVPGQKYDQLKELIENNTSAWCRPLSSFYIVRTNLTITQFKEKIRNVLDDNDEFLVIECTSNYSGWLDKKMWPYISDNIFR